MLGGSWASGQEAPLGLQPFANDARSFRSITLTPGACPNALSVWECFRRARMWMANCRHGQSYRGSQTCQKL